MKYLKYYLFTFLFLIYWSFTLLFVGPENYIKISLIEGEQFFNTFLYQKWGFFAPPPKHNDRLYYKFERKNDTTNFYTFEVISSLQQMKSNKAPFNSSEDMLDYVLSSTLHSITDGLVAVNEALDYQFETKNISELTDKIRISKGREYTQSTANFQTLKNYSLLVAKKNNLNINDFYITIEITQLEMPVFADRYEINEEKFEKENLIFQSDKFTIENK